MQHLNYCLMAGVDEAGRGPLIGSVVAAACILPQDFDIPGLTDSKKISEKKRKVIDLTIREQAVAWSIAEASAVEIDQLNILQASLLAMHRAVDALTIRPEFVLVDGNRLPNWKYSAEAIIGGDGIEPAISAASILAKVFRDKQMIELAQLYPHYGFETHKGYPTKHHLTAIEEYGILCQHRKTFGPIKRLLSI